jgi:S-adenosylmethionine:tRNA-ribosyltransferase-isomerase (queuine synthetase)
VHNSTKFFARFVFMGVFVFQVWIAERVAVTIFSRHGTEVWKSMVTEISLEKVKGHFIICGYGQVGRTVVRSVEQAADSLGPHRNQGGALTVSS